jgi:hypothetical protein
MTKLMLLSMCASTYADGGGLHYLKRCYRPPSYSGLEHRQRFETCQSTSMRGTWRQLLLRHRFPRLLNLE